MNTFISDFSHKEFDLSERVSAKAIRPNIMLLIQKDNPDFNSDSYLSISELNVYRQKSISEYLTKEVGEISELEQTVLNHIAENKTLSDKLDDDKFHFTFGQRLADKVATFGGSWAFIILFLFFILLWISFNIYMLSNKGFDPYPFILLNLILSCLAAIQAPVILMSQNRQEEKDRERAKNDYMINLKSEIEVRMLHEKIDHLLNSQHLELIEIQQEQMEMMNDIIKKFDKHIEDE